MCYNRGCNCNGCYYEDFFTRPLKCNMEYSVVKLIMKTGEPDRDLIEQILNKEK